MYYMVSELGRGLPGEHKADKQGGAAEQASQEAGNGQKQVLDGLQHAPSSHVRSAKEETRGTALSTRQEAQLALKSSQYG